MKMKLLPLFLMVLMVFSIAQPIFAGNPQLEDTKIAAKNGQPLQDITVNSGDSIELQARLYWYWYTIDNAKASWIPQICRYLDFYVYKSNADGTNGDLVWSDSAITNFFTANANPDEFTLKEKGTYNLLVKYEGKLKHCSGTAKIYVV
ncbi:MAG TPA: hypothetical protein VLR54_02565 [Methanobacteriaceae archaeon]|nr:hypothetical protein [Methanobacteriaceae archaeon]